VCGRDRRLDRYRAREDVDGHTTGATAASAVLAEALGTTLAAIVAGAVVTAAIHHAHAGAIVAALYFATAVLALALPVAARRREARPTSRA
jgi:hypothetical protein